MSRPPESSRSRRLRLAIPSDGELYEATLAFLRSCGLEAQRPSARRYTAEIASLPGMQVLFQRAADIPSKVDEGSADLGVVGLDRFQESHRDGGGAIVLVEDLGFGSADLVIAVPEEWVDVTSVADLGDLSVEFRQSAREFRVATKYPSLVERFLHRHGVHYFTLVQSSGTLEAAPAMGFADIIGDISATGVTLRENRLKTLEDGTVFSSQACLIGSPSQLGEEPSHLEMTRAFLERVEARLRAGGYFALTANVQGPDEESVALRALQRPDLSGIQGPTVARVYSHDSRAWFAVTIVVPKERLQEAVDHLRALGSSSVTVLPATYVYQARCEAYERLLVALRSR